MDKTLQVLFIQVLFIQVASLGLAVFCVALVALVDLVIQNFYRPPKKRKKP